MAIIEALIKGGFVERKKPIKTENMMAEMEATRIKLAWAANENKKLAEAIADREDLKDDAHQETIDLMKDNLERQLEALKANHQAKAGKLHGARTMDRIAADGNIADAKAEAKSSGIVADNLKTIMPRKSPSTPAPPLHHNTGSRCPWKDLIPNPSTNEYKVPL